MYFMGIATRFFGLSRPPSLSVRRSEHTMLNMIWVRVVTEEGDTAPSEQFRGYDLYLIHSNSIVHAPDEYVVHLCHFHVTVTIGAFN